MFDIAAASSGLIVLSPLFIAVAISVKLQDGGPVFYRARRIGRAGEPFELFKFRSMVDDADRKGPEITTAEDARVTAVGRLLRRTKLDELPQLVNVLVGDMSFVGPRPEDPKYVAFYTPEQRRVLDVRPGITSLASVRYRREEELLQGDDWETIYRTQIMPEKLAIDLQYLDERSTWRDLTIIWQTITSLFCRTQ